MGSLRVASSTALASAVLAVAAAAAQDGERVQVSAGATHGQNRPIGPDVAATSQGDKLVFWLQPVGNESPQRYQLWGGTVDGNDEPIGEPFAISAAARDGQPFNVSSSPAAAATPGGDGVLMLWGDGAAEDPFERELVGTRVGMDGAVGADTFSVAPSGIAPDIVYNPRRREYLAVWSKRGREIRARRLKPDGAAIGDSFRIWKGSGDGYPAMSPSVAYDPANKVYLVAWSANGFPDSSIYGRTVSGKRKPERGRTRPLVDHEIPGLPTAEVAFSQRCGEFVMASEEYGKIWLTRVSARGRRVGGSTFVAGRPALFGGAPAYDPGVAATERGGQIVTYTVYPEDPENSREHEPSRVYYQRFGCQLRLRRQHEVSTGPYEGYGPGVTNTPTGFGITWVQALGPDDFDGPDYSFGDREVFFRSVEAPSN
jgi:hypothetical protein